MIEPVEATMTTPSTFLATHPAPDEHAPYHVGYVSLVPEGTILDLLAAQINATCALLASAQADFRPTPADWSIAEVVGHLADTERVFAYRALRFARGDATPLPSFDQDHFVAHAGFAQRPLADLLDEFTAVRHTTLMLFRSLDEAAWRRQGVANNDAISVRAMAYIIAGHELHHVADFRNRYNV